MRSRARKVIMKKTLMILCIVLVAALLCVAFVACDTTTPDDNGGHNQYEQAKYTVTFNVNSNDFVMTNNVIKNVLSGTSISEPKNADGSRLIPAKTGYTFKYWSEDGKTEFVFGTTPIVKNTTLTAVYANNVYTLTPHLDKKIVATKQEDGTFKYYFETVSTGATLQEGTKLTVSYNSKGENLNCPTAASGDEFLFWFYMDSDGNPVRLTTFANSSDNAVKTEISWSLTKGVDVYAMFKSTLPRVKVEYADSLSDAVYDTKEYPVTDSILETEATAISESATKAGYKFAKWYYTQTVTVNGEEKTETKDFAFKTDKVTGTTLYSACGLKDYFTPATLKMYAKWTKQISIASTTDFELYYNLLRKENPTDSDKTAIAELLEADIKLQSIDFATKNYEPLFDENHVFTGTIDGAEYDAEGHVSTRAKLLGGTFGNAKHASVFGYVNGTLKNIVFENVNLKIDKTDGKYENVVYIGFVATVLGGDIENCSVTANPQSFGEKLTGQDWVTNGMKSVYFGGIAALVEGKSAVKDTGMVRDCTVNFNANFACESLTFGGICAVNNSASTLSYNKVDVTLSDVYCLDDTQSSNGRSFAKVGGISASNGGRISKSDVSIVVTKLESLDETYFGGVSADNTGSVITTKVNAKLLDATVGGTISQIVCIGGMIGKNEGYILNSHCDVDFNVKAQKQNGIVALGGLVGSNFSDKKDSSSNTTTGIGAINSCYAVGKLNLDATAEKVVLYVGGIAGRNSQSKIANDFVVLDITVKNVEGGTNNVGRTFGKHEKGIEFAVGTLLYANDSKLTFNGSADYAFTNTQQGSGEFSASAFKDATVVGDKRKILFDTEIWNIENGQYPTLK